MFARLIESAECLKMCQASPELGREMHNCGTQWRFSVSKGIMMYGDMPGVSLLLLFVSLSQTAGSL